MDPALAAVLGGLAGLLLGAVSLIAARASERSLRRVPPAPEPELPPGVAAVLSVLRSSAVVLSADDRVLKASVAAHAYRIVAGEALAHAEVSQMVRQVRRDGEIREAELELARGPLGEGRLVVHARVAPLGSSLVLVMIEDRTEARRVEEVRRDFVENVSHELKTPVGGLSLLAEAVQDASDDPEAVRRFAARMQVEATRLTRLVQEIVDLSRLQVAGVLRDPVEVILDDVVAEAVDRCRVAADARGIALTVGRDPRAVVFGDRDLLMTAVRNLIENAIAYSPEHTAVSVSVSVPRSVPLAIPASDAGPDSAASGAASAPAQQGELVTIAVVDQGVGITPVEQTRIFERFYRVDPARSRSTGGTGLGLAIVKHVCENHGGEVTVWSRPGVGSTFTMRLPASGSAHAGSASSARASRSDAGAAAVPDGMLAGGAPRSDAMWAVPADPDAPTGPDTGGGGVDPRSGCGTLGVSGARDDARDAHPAGPAEARG